MFDTIRLESNDSSQQMTIRRTGCRFAEEDMVEGSSFVMTSRSILVDSSAFNKTRHPPKLRRVFCCESPSIFHRVQVELKKKKKTENSY